MACLPTDSERSSRIRQLAREWALPIAELSVRIAAISLAADLLLRAPLPLEGTFLSLFQAFVILGAVALIGIALCETLFYNHFRP